VWRDRHSARSASTAEIRDPAQPCGTDNELLLALAEYFGGWGLQVRLAVTVGVGH
jgi:hypothetical protein